MLVFNDDVIDWMSEQIHIPIIECRKTQSSLTALLDQNPKSLVQASPKPYCHSH